MVKIHRGQPCRGLSNRGLSTRVRAAFHGPGEYREPVHPKPFHRGCARSSSLDLLHPMRGVHLSVLLCLLAAVRALAESDADDACQAVKTPAATAGTSIILIGNPGCGKSTLLNTLAGKNLFQSGVRYREWMLPAPFQLQLVHFPVFYQ